MARKREKQTDVKVDNYTLTSTRKLRDLRSQGVDDDKTLLALYDKRGGAVWKDGEKLPMGTFWDFKNNKPVGAKEVTEPSKNPTKATKKKATKKNDS